MTTFLFCTARSIDSNGRFQMHHVASPASLLPVRSRELCTSTTLAVVTPTKWSRNQTSRQAPFSACLCLGPNTYSGHHRRPCGARALRRAICCGSLPSQYLPWPLPFAARQSCHHFSRSAVPMTSTSPRRQPIPRKSSPVSILRD